MIAFRLWSFAAIAVVLISSFTDSKVMTNDKLAEIDQDLASILNQADTPDPDVQSAPLDNSATGFAPGESSKDTKENDVPKTVQMLNEDEAKRKVNTLIDYLSKDESQPPMDMPERPVETYGFSESNDDEKIPEDLLNDLESDRENMDMPVRPWEFQRVPANERMDTPRAPGINDREFPVRDEVRKDIAHAPGTIGRVRDEVRMDMPHSPGTIDRVRQDERMDMPRIPAAQDERMDMPRIPAAQDERIDMPRVPAAVVRDEVRIDMPEAPKANDRACPGLACKSKKELMTGILMDEFVSRMKSYVKRGVKVPRRMVDIWRKYRTKRRFRTPMM